MLFENLAKHPKIKKIPCIIVSILFIVKLERLFFFKDYFFLKMNEMSLGMFPESGGSSLSSLKIVKTKLKLNYSAFNQPVLL